jgi:hypothetical protein
MTTTLKHSAAGLIIGMVLGGALMFAQQPSGRGRMVFTEPSPMDFNDHEGYVPLFDGVSLNGWDGNPKFWRVEGAPLWGNPRRRIPAATATSSIAASKRRTSP